MPGKLSARQRIYVRKHTRTRDLDPSEAVGELNIVPFLDIVVNLIMFLLATTEAVLLIAQIESDLPKITRGRGKKSSVETPLNLNVTITANGVLVSGSGGKLAPGCQDIAPGGQVTVARKRNAYDWPGLTECVARVKQQFAEEDARHHPVALPGDAEFKMRHRLFAPSHCRQCLREAEAKLLVIRLAGNQALKPLNPRRCWHYA